MPIGRRDLVRAMTASKPRITNLVELFQQSVDRFAERRAFGWQRGREWQYITYAELDAMVARARAALAQLGVGRGDRVAIVCENRLEWVVLAQATFQRRAIFVPMSEAQHDGELKYILATRVPRHVSSPRARSPRVWLRSARTCST